MRTTGFHQANAVQPGTVIEHVYFTCPEHYSAGQEKETFADALEVAIARAEEQIARHAEHYPLTSEEHGFKPLVTVDVRWKMTKADGNGQDTVAERYHYDGVQDAKDHLDRIHRYLNQAV